VNHPSILFWDNGNEGGWNPALDGDFSLSTIPSSAASCIPGTCFDGIDTRHYANFLPPDAPARRPQSRHAHRDPARALRRRRRRGPGGLLERHHQLQRSALGCSSGISRTRRSSEPTFANKLDSSQHLRSGRNRRTPFRKGREATMPYATSGLPVQFVPSDARCRLQRKGHRAQPV
jgi:hypothetical protein